MRSLSLVLALLLAAPVHAQTPAQARTQSQAQVNETLRADREIWDGLFWMAVAHELRRVCSTIDARMLRALPYANALYDRARGYGYTRAQIKDFIEDEAEVARMRVEVLRYLTANGVREGVEDTYCARGRVEIAAESRAGQLIRAR
jgi:hypothetical protein